MTAPPTPKDQTTTRSLALTDLPPNSFLHRFVRINHLPRITHFLFRPGMLFNDQQSWWGEQRKRPHGHQGIDIQLMRDRDQRLVQVTAQMLVPLVLPGHPVHFHRDFLGETISVRHPAMRRGNAVLHTLHGHLAPPATHSTSAGFQDMDRPVGEIAPGKSTVPAHLHLSCAWIPEGREMAGLCWDTITKDDQVVLVDPMPFLLG